MAPKMKDHTGRQFGLLTVVGEAPPYVIPSTGGKSRRLRVRCECGKEKILRATHFMSPTGETKSCGCLSRRLTRSRNSLPERWMAARNAVLSSAKIGAKRRGLAFSISDETCFAIFAQPCNYCGLEPSNHYNCYFYKDGRSRGRFIPSFSQESATFLYSGLDRVDNTVGYVNGNVVPCCGLCNKAKSNLAESEFRAWIARLVTFNSRSIA